MKTRFELMLAVASLVVASQAFGEEPPPPLDEAAPAAASGKWSLYSGRTVGKGNVVVGPEVGWPGVSSYFAYGATDGFDVGGKFTFNYGTEADVKVSPSIAFHGLLRLKLYNQGMFSAGLRFEPGFGFFFDGGAGAIIHFPLGLEMGIHPNDLVSILFGLEFRSQILIAFANGGVVFGMPILIANPGIEFKLSENMLLTFRTGFGPGILAGNGGSTVLFSFRVLMGVAIKF